jgi:hypothetical protein
LPGFPNAFRLNATVPFRPTLERQRDDAQRRGQIGRQRIFQGLLQRLDQQGARQDHPHNHNRRRRTLRWTISALPSTRGGATSSQASSLPHSRPGSTEPDQPTARRRGSAWLLVLELADCMGGNLGVAGRCHPVGRRAVGDRSHVDKTYVKVASQWRHVYRAMDLPPSAETDHDPGPRLGGARMSAVSACRQGRGSPQRILSPETESRSRAGGGPTRSTRQGGIRIVTLAIAAEGFAGHGKDEA